MTKTKLLKSTCIVDDNFLSRQYPLKQTVESSLIVKNMIVCQGNLSHEDSQYCGLPVVAGDSFRQCAPQFPSRDQETHLRVPWNSTGSWGMTEMAVRNVCSPNFRMSIPSTSIVPLSTSTNRKRALTRELFPALSQKEKNIKLSAMP